MIGAVDLLEYLSFSIQTISQYLNHYTTRLGSTCMPVLYLGFVLHPLPPTSIEITGDKSITLCRTKVFPKIPSLQHVILD